MARPVSFIFRDAKSNIAKTKMWIAQTAANFEPTAATLVADLQAISNANVSSSIDNAAAPTNGTAATYLDVEDKAVLVFQDFYGAQHRFQVPAPKSTIFLADQETVDPTNSAVLTLINDMSSGGVGVTTRQGITLTGMLGGFRARRHLHRKVNINTKNPALTGPGE